MKTRNKIDNKKYYLAKKRTDELRKFYKHLTIYVVINLIISTIKVRDYIQDDYTFEEAFFQFDIFVVWIVWGVFVLLQAIKTFRMKALLGSDWENKKIQEFMNEKL